MDRHCLLVICIRVPHNTVSVASLPYGDSHFYFGIDVGQNQVRYLGFQSPVNGNSSLPWNWVLAPFSDSHVSRLDCPNWT